MVGSLVVDIAWLAIWLFVAGRYDSPFAFVLASLPVLKWLLLLVARHPRGGGPCDQPASVACARRIERRPTFLTSSGTVPVGVTGAKACQFSRSPPRRRRDQRPGTGLGRGQRLARPHPGTLATPCAGA